MVLNVEVSKIRGFLLVGTLQCPEAMVSPSKQVLITHVSTFGFIHLGGQGPCDPVSS